MDRKPVCLTSTGQCDFCIAPLIHNFLIYYMSFANLKNFGFVILHQYSRNLKFSHSVGCIYLICNLGKKHNWEILHLKSKRDFKMIYNYGIGSCIDPIMCTQKCAHDQGSYFYKGTLIPFVLLFIFFLYLSRWVLSHLLCILNVGFIGI